jgi:hypothetical protein
MTYDPIEPSMLTDLYALMLRHSTDHGPLLHALITTNHARAIWSMAFPGSFQHAVYHCCLYNDVKLLRLLVSRAPTYSVARVNWARMCAVCPLRSTEETIRSATTAFILNWTPIMRLMGIEKIRTTMLICGPVPSAIGFINTQIHVHRNAIKAQRKRRNTTMRNMRMRICIHRRVKTK